MIQFIFVITHLSRRWCDKKTYRQMVEELKKNNNKRRTKKETYLPT